MIIEWEKIQKRHDELTQTLTDPFLDHKKRNDLNKELSRIAALLEKYNKIANPDPDSRFTQTILTSEQKTDGLGGIFTVLPPGSQLSSPH